MWLPAQYRVDPKRSSGPCATAKVSRAAPREVGYIAVLLGQASGGLCMFDFDDDDSA
jgi:hypothetical protein